MEWAAVINHKADAMAEFRKCFGVKRQYENVEALLKNGAMESLVIWMPINLHAPQTIAASSTGVQVMVEKLMAMNANEFGQMNGAAAKTGATLMVAHCWRFVPNVLWLKEQSAKWVKVIGTNLGVHTHWGPSGWFTQKEFVGGGAMAGMGIHALDIARVLLGVPKAVSVYA